MDVDLSTQATPVEFRALRPDDQEAVVELVRPALYGPDFPDLAGYWRWKHYENPFGESFGLVATAEGRLVAVRAFMQWQLCGGGRLVRVGRAVDTAVVPGWRRRGLFEQMTMAMLHPMVEQGLSLTFNTPNAMSTPGYLKMGWAHLGRLPLRVKVSRPLRVASAMAKSRALQPSARPLASPGFVNQPDNGALLHLLHDSAVEELVQKVGAVQLCAADPRSPLFRLRTALSPAYLEWHYGRNRWYQYAGAYESRGSEAALVIGRLCTRAGLTEVLVTEVVATTGRSSRSVAARAAARLARDTRADYLAISGLGQTLGACHGYFPVGRRGISVTVRVLESDLPVDPATWAGWAAGIGDFELF